MSSEGSDSFQLNLQEESGVITEFLGNDVLDRGENSDQEEKSIHKDQSLEESAILAEQPQVQVIERPIRELSAEDLNTTEHPLETIEKYERNISSRLAGSHDLETKFILSNFKATVEGKFASIDYNVLDAITRHCFPDEYGELPLHNDQYWGIPKCVGILPGHYIAIGTSGAIIVLFNYTLTSLQKFGTQKEKEYGGITTIDISSKDEVLICGHENGNIVLWSIEKNVRLKKIKSPEKCPIISIKFLKETKQQFVATTTKGSIYLYKVEQVLLKLGSDKKLIFPTETTKRRPQQNAPNGPMQSSSEGFYSAQVLPKEFTREHPLNKYTLIAFTSANQVLVMSTEPNIRVLYTSDRPNGVSESILPCASWGRGAIPAYEDNRHPLLALSWGKNLYLIQFESVDSPEAGGIRNVGFYLSDENIFHLEWFSENNLLIYNSKGELKVLYSGYFKQNPSPDYSKAVMDTQTIDLNLRFQLYTEGRVAGQSAPARYYSNTIRGISASRRVFIMGEQKMFVGKHFEWSEYIKDLTSKAEWLMALSLCVEFFKGTIKKYAGVPNNPEERKQALEPVSKQLITNYINSISKINDIQPDWVTAILTTIDFLVCIGNFDFLFMDMRMMFEQLNLKDLFLESLEPFILKNRITHVPNEAFKEIVRYYIGQKKPDVIQHLIVSLAIENLDFDFTIILCMENNLLTALLYLCSHKLGEGIDGPDFITPISKAINSYQRALEVVNQTLLRLEEESRDRRIDLQELKDKSRELIRFQAQAKELAIRFLWFLHMTINGRKFPHGVIPDNIWEKQIKDIIIMLFEEQNLDLMIKAEPYVSFEIFKLLFQPTVSRVVESFQEGSIYIASSRKSSVSQDPRDISTSGLDLPDIQQRFVETIHNKLQGQMLGLIYYCGKKNFEYENQLYFWFADLVVYMGYTIPYGVIEECISYILQNWRIIPPWEYNKKRLEEGDEELEAESSDEDRNIILLGLLRKVRDHISKDKLEEFALLADKTELVDVRVYLLEIGQHYKKGFELYLSQRKEINKLKVFPWLDQVIPNLKLGNQAKFNQMKDEIIKHLSDLVSINSEKARKVILGLDRSLEIEVIHYLKPFPYLQLNYLKRILAKREEGFDVPDHFLVLHIKLLCQLFPKQVYPEVQAYNYPLDECLKICKEHDVRDALGFFLEKAGNSLEALEAWIEFFLKSLKKKMEKVEKRGVFSVGRVVDKFDSVRALCMRHTKLGDYESEKLWFKLLDRLLQYYDEHIANNKNLGGSDLFRDFHTTVGSSRLVKVISECIATLFDDLTKNVLVESLMMKLQDYKTLKLGDLKTSLVGMLQTYHHENNLLTDATTLLKGDIYDNVSDIYSLAAEGFKTDSLVINDEGGNKMIMFECGHLFPKDCVEAKVCLICSDAENIRADHILNNIKRGYTSLRPGRNPANAPGNPDASELLASDRAKLIEAFKKGKVAQQIGEVNSKGRHLTNMSKFEDSKVDKSKDWDEFMKRAI